METNTSKLPIITLTRLEMFLNLSLSMELNLPYKYKVITLPKKVPIKIE